MTRTTALPAPDHTLSPRTGYTREHWAAVADAMLLALRPYFSPGRARLLLPGRTSAYGTDSDALEGFARSFMLAAFRVHGEHGHDPLGLLEPYRAGLISGTDPGSGESWPLPDQLGQAKVEAASIALGLHLTRPWLWDGLSPDQQANVVSWLSRVNGETYPANNWVWFRAVVETFVAAAGGPYERADIEASLRFHESLARPGGWYSDGLERSFDHYSGWALQFYPLLWAGMARAAQDATGDGFGTAGLVPLWRERLSAYLDDAIHLIGADGSPLLQGRSLTYRFAVAAPFWIGAATGATALSPGLIRRAASGMLRHFLTTGALDHRGLLSVGWHREWPAMAQSYSGSGSPYWAAKGMFGLALPADHPVWTAVEEPLPVELADTRRIMVAPGWLVGGTVADGLVRVLNHGTDHAQPGDQPADSPLYARLGYSTATVPPLTGTAPDSPLDSSVTVLGPDGRSSHRSGFERILMDDDGTAARAVSRSHEHWVDDVDPSAPDYGSGRRGTVRPGPVLTVGSLLHGRWEVRAARVEHPETAPPGSVLRFGGWPLAAPTPPAGSSHDGTDGSSGHQGIPGRIAVRIDNGRLTSAIALAVSPDPEPEGTGDSTGADDGDGDARAEASTESASGVHRELGTSPLGEHVAIPWITVPLRSDTAEVRAVLILLAGSGPGYGADASPGIGSSATVGADANVFPAEIAADQPEADVIHRTVRVVWADGTRSELEL